MLSLLIALAADPVQIQSAGCWVRTEHGALVVRDVWSRRWSVPGGGRESGETPMQTAERELLEETGLVGHAMQPLVRFGAFQLFHCEVDTPIPILRMRDGFRMRVPAGAKNEIDDIEFLTLETVGKKRFRFPSQKDPLLALLPKTLVKSPVTEQPADVSFAVAPNRWIQTLRSSVMDAIMYFLNLFGEEKMYFILLPFFWLVRPWREGYRLTMLLIASAALNGLLKSLFEAPRPRDLDPLLAVMHGSGFGFPSGHTQIATVFLGWLYFSYKSLQTRRILAILLVGIVGTGLARLYFGAHLLGDLLGGWGLGCLLLALDRMFPALCNSPQKAGLKVIGLIGAILIWLRPHPEALGLTMIALGIAVGLKLRRPEDDVRNVPTREAIGRWAVGLVGMFLIPEIVGAIAPSDRTFSASVGIVVAQYFALGLWLSWLSARVTHYCVPSVKRAKRA